MVNKPENGHATLVLDNNNKITYFGFSALYKALKKSVDLQKQGFKRLKILIYTKGAIY